MQHHICNTSRRALRVLHYPIMILGIICSTHNYKALVSNEHDEICIVHLTLLIQLYHLTVVYQLCIPMFTLVHVIPYSRLVFMG